MLEGVRRIVAEGLPHAGIELVLSVQEETGLHGVKAFDCSQFAARFGYVYDHAGADRRHRHGVPVAVLDRRDVPAAAPRTPASPRRRAATRSPRRRDALAELRFGRLDDETTANVGTIAGGVARNIVADRCDVRLEVRSRDHERALKETPGHARRARARGQRRRVRARDGRDAGVPRLQAPPHRSRRAGSPGPALEACGYAPSLLATGGGADAHLFNERGIPCANLGNGMELIHTPDERIAVGRRRGDGRRHARARRGRARRELARRCRSGGQRGTTLAPGSTDRG